LMPTSLDFSAVQPPANGLEKKNPTKHAKTPPKPTRQPENTGILETRFQFPPRSSGYDGTRNGLSFALDWRWCGRRDLDPG